MRPAAFAGDTSPDIEWVEHTLKTLTAAGRAYDAFSLLRPTSPFRTADTMRRAWAAFCADPRADSLRAVEKCTQHPGKMWVARGNRLLPLLPFGLVPPQPQGGDGLVSKPAGGEGGQPWHSSQYQSLPLIYVQNASLEIAWSRIVLEGRTIAGESIVPFFTDDMEGFDINNRYDWLLAEHMVASGEATLPVISDSDITGGASAALAKQRRD